MLGSLLGMGGPRYDETVAHAARVLRERGGAPADEVFAAGPAELRRPVELLGYLELAAPDALDAALGDDDGIGDVPAARLRRVTAVRADGSTRELVVPRVGLTVPDGVPDDVPDDEVDA